MYRTDSEGATGTWATVAATTQSSGGKTYETVPVTTLGIYTLAASNAVSPDGGSTVACPGLVAASCFTAANVTFTSGMGTQFCSATIQAADAAVCGGCTFTLSMGDVGANCSTPNAKMPASDRSASGMGMTICADANGIATEAAKPASCASFGPTGP